MTTPHPLILAELQKYRGGEFVPSYTNKKIHLLEYCMMSDGSMAFCWCDGGSVFYGREHDAHAHIELAAWKMVRHFCKRKDTAVLIADSLAGTSGTFIVSEPQSTKDEPVLLGFGPTDADALLASAKAINAKEPA